MITKAKHLVQRILRGPAELSIEAPKWLLVVILGFVSLGFAQDDPSDWQTPENLSSSGSATEPQILVDSAGVVHVIWPDSASSSFVYRRKGPDGWGDAQFVELPFGSRRFIADLNETDPTPLFIPTMVADASGNVHAFWLDADGVLFHSQVAAGQFNEFEAWLAPQRLVNAAAGLSAAVDANGGLHISYVQTQPDDVRQAGIYYRKLASVEEGWTEPVLIYASSYYNQLPEAQASTNLATRSVGGDSYVYLTWDNRPLEKLFFARSVDGGLSWEEPTIVDERQPEDGPETAGPAKIMVAVDDNNVLLFWQAGHGLNLCSQYYQISADNGETWQASQPMLEDLFGCPESNHFVAATDDFNLYFLSSEDRPYLVAWNGNQWSDPQIQQDLSSFISPETFRTIRLGCHQFALAEQDQLIAVGCGAGHDEQIEDVWQMSRSVGDIDSWFPSAPVWGMPEAVITDGNNLLPPIMAADSQGRMHAVWAQEDDINRSRTAVIYASWDDGQWSPAVPVLTSPEGSIEQLEMMMADDDQMMVIWVSSSGKVYFSQSSSDEAILRSDWSSPIELPTSQSFIGGADIATSDDGAIYIAYSVPINEDRGVYLLGSIDGGRSWSEPLLALDGATNDWEIVGTPRLEVTSDGQFHLLATEEVPVASGTGEAATALFYSRSDSLEGEFSQPQLVSETRVTWADLVDDGQHLVHRIWQEQTSTATDVRHEFSVDGGHSWSESTRVTDQLGPIGIAADTAGQLHTVQVDDRALSYRVWNGERWQAGEGLEAQQFEAPSLGEPQSVNVAVGPNQILAALFTGLEFTSGSSTPVASAYYSWRIVDEATAISLPAPAPSPTPSISETPVGQSTTPEVEATATITPTPDTSSQGESDGGGSGLLDTDNSIVRLVLAVVPVALFLVIIVGAGMWFVRRRSR